MVATHTDGHGPAKGVVVKADGKGVVVKPGLHDLPYYGKCMVGGVIACGATHAAVVTFDLCKCRSQAHAKSGLWPKGFFAGAKRILAEEGVAGLKTGWVPTFFGYGVQGLFKFGLNEFFKDVYTMWLGGTPDVKWQKMLLWAAASGSAEFFADIGLCPFEMTKVKMQVTLPSDPNFAAFPRRLMPALAYMGANSAQTRYPFGSLKPLWLRQIPYTMIKFVGFYATSEYIYEFLEKRGYRKAAMSDAQKLTITFAAGYFAGVFCAIATQAADNLVSMKGNPEYQSKSFKECAEIMGMKNLFTRGLGTRIFMIGTLTGLQWWIYGSFKNYCGFGTQ